MRRATMSLAPPAANGTIRRMGWVGQVWAEAGVTTHAARMMPARQRAGCGILALRSSVMAVLLSFQLMLLRQKISVGVIPRRVRSTRARNPYPSAVVMGSGLALRGAPERLLTQ